MYERDGEFEPAIVSFPERMLALGQRALNGFVAWANKQDLNPVEGFGGSAIPADLVDAKIPDSPADFLPPTTEG